MKAKSLKQFLQNKQMKAIKQALTNEKINWAHITSETQIKLSNGLIFKQDQSTLTTETRTKEEQIQEIVSIQEKLKKQGIKTRLLIK
jgi:hypothetical protein